MSGDAARLAPLLALDAHRAEVGFRPDPRRLAEGWEYRFVADGVRAEEAVALYRALGFEVCAEPVDGARIADACAECRLAVMLRFRAIYTRRRPAP
ncbi:MAG TPA: hypothetical protein VFQ38_01995 [Longimicrobiales bacterium]|nr:hypothetical protein [Longimicrobiales bacterium]